MIHAPPTLLSVFLFPLSNSNQSGFFHIEQQELPLGYYFFTKFITLCLIVCLQFFILLLHSFDRLLEVSYLDYPPLTVPAKSFHLSLKVFEYSTREKVFSVERCLCWVLSVMSLLMNKFLDCSLLSCLLNSLTTCSVFWAFSLSFYMRHTLQFSVLWAYRYFLSTDQPSSRIVWYVCLIFPFSQRFWPQFFSTWILVRGFFHSL